MVKLQQNDKQLRKEKLEILCFGSGQQDGSGFSQVSVSGSKMASKKGKKLCLKSPVLDCSLLLGPKRSL
jgi:hypothetical protein